jgi:lysophospholipase L1-like esterase
VGLWGLVTRPITSASVLVAQVLHAAHRNDLPSLQNQDPSGAFGDPDLPRLRIVILGDSSVTAPGVNPLDACWARRVARHLTDRFRVELETVAVGGAKVRDVLNDQLEPALATRADMALVSVGANDALRATPVPRYEAELERVVERLTAHIPMVGLSGVGDLGTVDRLPTLARSIARVRGRAIDHAILRVVRRHPGVVKSRTWEGPWRAFEYDPTTFAPDLFHASASGHALFAAAMVSVVEALLDAAASGVSASPGNLG